MIRNMETKNLQVNYTLHGDGVRKSDCLAQLDG